MQSYSRYGYLIRSGPMYTLFWVVSITMLRVFCLLQAIQLANQIAYKLYH